MARWGDSESEFSETDISIEESPRRRRFKRTSLTRRKASPDSNTFLSPGVISVRRSHSTGGRHKRKESPSPVVVVDVNNDVRARGVSNERRSPQLFGELDDFDEIDLIRTHRRPRAQSHSRPASRDRDWELMMDQRILEKNDTRQDMEIMKQQQEIDRLKMKLTKSHEKKETRLIRHEEEEWEDELSDKLRKLDRLERRQRLEEERKHAAYREKVKKLEELEQRAVEEKEAKRLAREEHYKKLERIEHDRKEKERLQRELRDEEARRLLEEEERKKEREKLKQEAVREWRSAQEAQKLREIEEKERKDKEFKERLRREFGYSEEQIEAMLHKDKERSRSPHRHHEKSTYIKVHRKYLLPETLIAYQLPWDWDERDSNYVIIKTYVSNELQEELFAHTKRLREGKLVTETSNTLTELKVNDKKRDKMYIVRKKPGKSAYFITS